MMYGSKGSRRALRYFMLLKQGMVVLTHFQLLSSIVSPKDGVQAEVNDGAKANVNRKCEHTHMSLPPPISVCDIKH